MHVRLLLFGSWDLVLGISDFSDDSAPELQDATLFRRPLADPGHRQPPSDRPTKAAWGARPRPSPRPLLFQPRQLGCGFT
jgi:hypothetical protein